MSQTIRAILRAILLEMAARSSSSNDRSDERTEFIDKPLDTWAEGDVQCFVNSNFSAEIAKKFKGKVSFVLLPWLRCCLSSGKSIFNFTNVLFINRGRNKWRCPNTLG